MNGKVARMLRKTKRDTHRAKKWWYSLESTERGSLRSDWNKMKEIYDRHADVYGKS